MADSLIKHVIVLMLENRSFDHILADCPKNKQKYDPTGINKSNGKSYRQSAGAARSVAQDPLHETTDVLIQLEGNGSVQQNGGFVLNYAQHYPQLADPSEVMKYHAHGALPALHALADTFTVCDHWHASVPGPTWVNRLFVLSGTEPAYLQPGANDAHPPHDMIESDVLVANVYNAIRANEALWNSTLLLILFDEHGGFYDHVSPPAAIPPDHHTEEYTFDRYGVRVPALLVSPYAANGLFSDVLDHTSLLKFLQDLWGLGDLGARTAAANSFQSALRVDEPARADTPTRIVSSTVSAGAALAAVNALNDHQSAIVAMSHNLESMTAEDPNVVAARSRHVLTGPQSQIDAAVDRVDSFLAQQKGKV
jgi:phospholipase C